MNITTQSAMHDLREAFLSRIFKGYPDHKKLWKAEDVQNEFSGAMYEVAVEYLSRLDRGEK